MHCSAMMQPGAVWCLQQPPPTNPVHCRPLASLFFSPTSFATAASKLSTKRLRPQMKPFLTFNECESFCSIACDQVVLLARFATGILSFIVFRMPLIDCLVQECFETRLNDFHFIHDAASLAVHLCNDEQFLQAIADCSKREKILGLCAEGRRLTAALVKNCHSSGKFCVLP